MADFDDIDLDTMGEVEDIDLSTFGTVEEEIKLPHLKFSGTQFKFLIRLAKSLSVPSGRDVISKSILIHPNNDKIEFYLTDFDVYFFYELDRINVQNVLTEDIIIPTDYLDKLARAIGNKVTIFKDGDDFKLSLLGGDIILETYNVDVEKFKFKDTYNKQQSIASKDLHMLVKDFSTIVSNAISPSERRILCDKDMAFASYMWGNITCKKSFSDMDLKVKDIKVLSQILSEVEEELEIFETDDKATTKRKVIKGNNFYYAFLISDSTVSESIRNNIKEVINLSKGKCYVDFANLLRLADISSVLPNSTGKLEFNYCESGVQVTLKLKKGDSTFTLVGSKEGDTTPFSTNFTISSKLLLLFLKAFTSQLSVAFFITDKGIGISSNEYDAILYKENL